MAGDWKAFDQLNMPVFMFTVVKDPAMRCALHFQNSCQKDSEAILCSVPMLQAYAKQHCNNAIFQHLGKHPEEGLDVLVGRFAFIGMERLFAETITLLLYKLEVSPAVRDKVWGPLRGKGGGGLLHTEVVTNASFLQQSSC